MSASRPWSSLAFRLGLSYGAIMALTMTIVLAVFYVQTVGVVRVRLDKQAENHLRRLMEHSAKYGPGALESEILQTIRDGVNTDTEILILMDPDGEPIVSNAEVFPARKLTTMGVRELTVNATDASSSGVWQWLKCPTETCWLQAAICSCSATWKSFLAAPASWRRLRPA